MRWSITGRHSYSLRHRGPGPDHGWPSRCKQQGKQQQNSPETHLTVAGGIGVPGGDGLEHLGQPAPLSDGLSKRRGRHGDG